MCLTCLAIYALKCPTVYVQYNIKLLNLSFLLHGCFRMIQVPSLNDVRIFFISRCYAQVPKQCTDTIHKRRNQPKLVPIGMHNPLGVY